MKKRTTARIISILLAAAMLITAAPVTGNAAEITADDRSVLTEGEALSGDAEAGQTDETGAVSEGAEITDAADEVIEDNGQALILDENGNTADIADEETGDDEATGDIFTGNPVSGDGLSDNAVSGNSVSENTVSGNTVSANTVSGNGVEDPDGYMYPGENEYTVVFTGKNDGKTKTVSILNDLDTSKKASTFLVDKSLYTPIMVDGLKDEEGSLVNGFSEKITGWSVTIDGVYFTKVNDHLQYTEGGTVYELLLHPAKDYIFTACVQKAIADELYIDVISEVSYTGQQHVTKNTRLKKKDKKGKINDIDLNVYYKDGTDNILLTQGKDYTVKYKNNTESSMKMDAGNNGNFEQKQTDLNKRPYVIVTGKGNYKGFSGRAYFDIYPYNFGKQDPHVEISGLKNTYTLKNGKIAGFKAPKITITHKGMKKKTLKEGKDYEVVIHKYVTGNWIMQKYYSKPGQPLIPAGELTEEGQYLYAVRGKGNYCGIFGGQNTAADFGATVPFVCDTYTEPRAPWQFRIVNDAKYDLANMKVEIKHPTVNYDFSNSMLYNASTAFGLTVKYKDGSKWIELENNTYYVYFIGKSFDYIYGLDSKDNAVISK